MSLLACVVLFHVPVAPTGAPLTDYFGYGFLTGKDSLPGYFDATFSPPWVPTGDSKRISADQYLPDFTPYIGPPATTDPSGAVHDSPLLPNGVMLDDSPVDPLTPTFVPFGALGVIFSSSPIATIFGVLTLRVLLIVYPSPFCRISTIMAVQLVTSRPLDSKSQYVYPFLGKAALGDASYLDNYWGTNENLIGFGRGAAPRAQIR